MKIKNMIKFSLFVFSISIMFIACQWVSIEPVVTDNTGGADTVKLSTYLQPIFTSNCITCHASRNPVLTQGNTYNSLTTGGFVDILNPTSSKIVIQTNTGHGGLTPTQKNNLLIWIQQGAKNN
jgi:hypothetical protein